MSEMGLDSAKAKPNKAGLWPQGAYGLLTEENEESVISSYVEGKAEGYEHIVAASQLQ